uniref:Major capsid protein L1 n=1 Tax=Anthurium amnicola TaxID=1678845 RepID=A0A1D1YSR1_9ARAE
MASSSAPTSLLLLSVLSFLAIGASGRPCKTLFVSYTVSSASAGALSGSTIAVSQISASSEHAPSRFYAFYRVIPPRFYRDPFYAPSFAAATEPLARSLRLPAGIERPALPRPAVRAEPSVGLGSLRERARDILVVVAGLLFGIGCGGLASATLYLACCLCNNRDGYDYDEHVEDEMESPKKRGYADLPAAPATPVTPLKEGYEGN